MPHTETLPDQRRVVAIDPATGETIWTYRLPNTARFEYSMRKDYGKGVAEVDGRGVSYAVTPGFFLTALGARTRRPLEGFGKPVPVDRFPETGVVDLLTDLGHEYDPYDGIPPERGYVTSSSPLIAVNGVVVVRDFSRQAARVLIALPWWYRTGFCAPGVCHVTARQLRTLSAHLRHNPD